MHYVSTHIRRTIGQITTHNLMATSLINHKHPRHASGLNSHKYSKKVTIPVYATARHRYWQVSRRYNLKITDLFPNMLSTLPDTSIPINWVHNISFQSPTPAQQLSPSKKHTCQQQSSLHIVLSSHLLVPALAPGSIVQVL